MDMHSPEGAALTPTKRALLEIRQLRAQLAEAKKAWHEPIAIVGMGMRFPGGVHDAESFAKLLWSGADAVTEIPADRWSLDEFYAEDPDAVGKMTTRHGAFLEHVDKFDAEFFGISPREAASMDPQQRLMLEVAWEALEDAGHAPSSLDGSRTGIYVGVANNDYGACSVRPHGLDRRVRQYGKCLQRGCWPFIVFPRAARAEHRDRYGLFIVARRAASGVPGAATWRMRSRARWRRQCHSDARMNINFSKARMMAPDWPVQDVRRRCRRVCTRRRSGSLVI